MLNLPATSNMPPPITIPVYKPDLSGKEKIYVNECLDTTWISSKGVFINRFQDEFSKYIGAKDSVAVCNGTVALHLALLALDLGPGDEIIVPSLTYIAAVNAIRYVGATPIFADSKLDTWQVDPEDVARRITPKTKAILAVHLYGQACEMGNLCALAKKHNLFVIEDCAEAFGTKIGKQHVGTFGDIATFSFFGNKTITTGEGGMVTAKDPAILKLALKLRGQGLADTREYWHDVVGYNYRMTNICAAIGLAQLERADEFIAKKRAVKEKLQAELKDLPIEFHSEVSGTTHSYWMISILTQTADQRDALRDSLRQAGIETRPLFHPAHTMPMYARTDNHLKRAMDLASRGINLPSWPGLSDKEISHIAQSIRRHFNS
jgi:perosamine synthetase